MVVAGATLARLLVSSATIYLCVGYLADPGGLNLIVPDPLHHADVIGRVAEVALLISLFTVGLRMGVPIFDRRWMVPLRLAFVSMAITVGLIAALGMWGLGLPMGAAVLLGGHSGAHGARSRLWRADRARYRSGSIAFQPRWRRGIELRHRVSVRDAGVGVYFGLGSDAWQWLEALEDQ